ncbi:MAG: helix-turn-helix transcriptional regulator [Chloroflexota bacterium]
MFGPRQHHRAHFGSAFFGPHRRWADGEPPPDWPFGQFGRRWGGFGGFNQGSGGPGSGERPFGRGDLKYVILDLLKDQPRHGYDIIRALEDRMGGRYRPSPGSVYPTLQMLEDLGYVTSNQLEGKKVYSITDEGRRYLTEQASTMDDIRSRIAAGWDAAQRPETADLMHELRELARALFRQGTRAALKDPERLKRLREIVARARVDVERLDQDPPASAAAASTTEPRMV